MRYSLLTADEFQTFSIPIIIQHIDQTYCPTVSFTINISKILSINFRLHGCVNEYEIRKFISLPTRALEGNANK